MSRKSHKTWSVFNGTIAAGIVLLLNVSIVTPAQAQAGELLSTAPELSHGKPEQDENNKNRYPRSLGTQTIKGIVKDAADPAGQPIANARVTLIRSNSESPAIEVTTNPQGKFVLRLNKGTDTDGEHLAVSVHAENFRPREVNISTARNNSILLSPENTYNYFEPVQLDDGIETGDLNYSNLDPDLINQLMVKTVQQGARGYRELHSLLIYKDGRLVVEEYYRGNNDYIDFEGGILRKEGDPGQIQWGRTDKHYLASVNKALTATVTGIALEQFGGAPETLISDLLPEYADYFTNANKAAVTLHDMLTMQLGYVWDEWGRDDLALLWQSDDFTEFLLNRNNRGPQSAWVYNSASPNMLLRGLDHLVPGSIRDWADENFYSKLGITDYDWQSQPDGFPEGAARMHMRPRDMLKVGVTYLDNGVWNDEQVIPANWVEEVSRVQVSSSAGDYSYFFWMRELNGVNYLSADGDGGQYINIFPEQNMVIVMTQGNYLEWPLYVNQANDMMGTFILPAVKPQVWSEEFNAGSAPDADVWSYDLGQTGWGKNELQEYTSDASNVRVEGGNLIITALRDGDHFTSARVKTQDRFTFTYGTVEARIKTPDLADGLQPAFWTLGNNFPAVGSPQCGEIDIMKMGNSSGITEGVLNRRIGSATHTSSSGSSGDYLDVPSGINDTFVMYRMEWTPTSITTYIDGQKIFSTDISGIPEFQKPHFLILNLAVGGSYTGIADPDFITASFPAEYVVDYIRLFDNGHTVIGNPPVFKTDPVIRPNALENGLYSETIAGSATDENAGDSLTYSRVSGPAWLNVADDGVLSGRPGIADLGLNSWTVQVSDGFNTVSATLEITVENVNDAPVFFLDSFNKPNATEDSVYSKSIAGLATDVDAGDTLTYSKVSGPDWLIVAGNGALSGIPENDDVGANAFTIKVEDVALAFDIAALNITVVNVNDAPAFTTDPVIGIDAVENSVYLRTLAGSAYDVDAGATLTYSKISGPAWLNVFANGTMVGTPADVDVGLNSWTVQVSDGIAAPVTATLEITVDGISAAPIIMADALGIPDGSASIPPSLSIQVSESNLEIRWPASYTAYNLCSSTNLTPPVVWSPVTNSPIIQGDHWMVTIPIVSAPPFFQLKTP